MPGLFLAMPENQTWAMEVSNLRPSVCETRGLRGEASPCRPSEASSFKPGLLSRPSDDLLSRLHHQPQKAPDLCQESPLRGEIPLYPRSGYNRQAVPECGYPFTLASTFCVFRRCSPCPRSWMGHLPYSKPSGVGPRLVRRTGQVQNPGGSDFSGGTIAGAGQEHSIEGLNRRDGHRD
jgi:hypothetical protein